MSEPDLHALTAADSGLRSTEPSAIDYDVYRDRVRLYLKVLFFHMTAFALVEILLIGRSELNAGSLLVATLGAAWAWTARSRPARAALLAMESVGSLAMIGLLAYLIVAEPSAEARFYILPLTMFVLTLRASIVPSSVGRSVTVGLLAIVITMLGVLARAPRIDPIEQIWTATMGLALVAVTAVASQVIYGLRAEVRRANRLGQYELVRKLGEGSMGEVYEATHTLLRRPTAVKVLKGDRAGEAAIRRFEREVRQTSRLEHPNSVYIYDFGRTSDGHFYYAMEFLDGLDLQELVRDHGPLPDGRVAHIVRQAAAALAEAHDMKLVHRDVKPANIVLCDRAGIPDTVKVLDFGLVKSLEPTDTSLTHADTIVGTPTCLAPEAIADPESIGPPADIYGLGVTAYYLLTGRFVFEASSVIDLCTRHLRDQPRPPSQVAGRAIDGRLEEVVLRCLAKGPEERYRDGRELATALSALGPLDWTMTQASEWWAEHRPPVAAPRSVEDTETMQLGIDIGARS